jgi:hypothetical protein
MNTVVQNQALLTRPRPTLSAEVLSDPPDQMTAGWHEPIEARPHGGERVGDGTGANMTAAAIASALGGIDLHTLREHHVELLCVAAELARDAGDDWPWGHDDPTVAVIRTISKLAMTAPDVKSKRAADLIRACAWDGR